MRKEVKLLLKRYDQYGKIILGVDFDDTLYPYTKGDKIIADRCIRIRDLVRLVKPYAHICMWTLGDAWSVGYKETIMELWGMKPDFVNSSPFEVEGARKPYFNLLLDDNAGLNEAIEILEEFIREVTNTTTISASIGIADNGTYNITYTTQENP